MQVAEGRHLFKSLDTAWDTAGKVALPISARVQQRWICAITFNRPVQDRLVITRKLRLLSYPQQCGCRQAWGAMRLEEIRIKDVECMSLNNLRMNKSWKLLHTFFILTTSFLSIPEGHSRAMVFRPMATMPQCTRELH